MVIRTTTMLCGEPIRVRDPSLQQTTPTMTVFSGLDHEERVPIFPITGLFHDGA